MLVMKIKCVDWRMYLDQCAIAGSTQTDTKKPEPPKNSLESSDCPKAPKGFQKVTGKTTM